MSNESDGENEDVAKGGAIENTPLQDAVPSRKSAAALEGEPPVRPSAAVLPPGPQNYPDDGPFSARLRRIDHLAGLVQQILLFAMLGVVVLVGTFQALATKLTGTSFVWSFDVVRGCTFVVAMVGAAFASHHASHLSMDIASRWLAPRSRLVAQVILGLFTIFAAFLLLQSGLHLRTQVASEGGSHTIPPDLIAAMIPIGSALIIFHTLMRVLIDADYLRRGKLPPAKALSAH